VLCQISIARRDGDLRQDEAAPLMWSTLLALLRSACSALMLTIYRLSIRADFQVRPFRSVAR